MHPRIAAKMMRSLREKDENEPSPFTEVSDRELEVLRLIAEGLANAEIAAKLFISEKTVKSHVSNILSKLHLSHRTQAAILAWKSGVMQKQLYSEHSAILRKPVKKPQLNEVSSSKRST